MENYRHPPPSQSRGLGATTARQHYPKQQNWRVSGKGPRTDLNHHQTDLFTTFARLARAQDQIPTDRVIDGIDRTSMFLNGDGFSRRNWVHVYTGTTYAATVKGRFKRHWVGDLPGLSGASLYDLYNDPREEQPKMLPMFPTKGMFNVMRARHLAMVEKYPHSAEARGFPFSGIENARPETVKASRPRFDPKDVPFDVRSILRRSPEWAASSAVGAQNRPAGMVGLMNR